MELEITKEVTDLVLVSNEKIISQSDLDHASAMLVCGKGLIRKIKDYFAPMKQDAHASWKRICDRETEELGKLTVPVQMLERRIVDYRVEQDRIRREAEEKARRQEEERRRLEEKALREAEEKERLAREAADRAAREQDAAARKKAQDEAAKRQAEADRIMAKAAAEEKKLEPVVIVPEKVVMNGVTIRHNWKFRVVDLAAVPVEYHLINEVMVGKIVRASEGKARIPGIEVYDEPTTVRTK